MKRNSSSNNLLVEELADLLDAENQLVQVLPKMVGASDSAALKAALGNQLEIARDHARQLQDIFSNIGQQPPRVTCQTINRIVEESEPVVKETQKYRAHDAAIIGIAQRMEQYEIAGYLAACEHAVDLGHTKIVEVLNKFLDEERAMNLHLNELSQNMINVQAIKPEISRFIDEGNPNI